MKNTETLEDITCLSFSYPQKISYQGWRAEQCRGWTEGEHEVSESPLICQLRGLTRVGPASQSPGGKVIHSKGLEDKQGKPQREARSSPRAGGQREEIELLEVMEN